MSLQRSPERCLHLTLEENRWGFVITINKKLEKPLAPATDHGLPCSTKKT